MRALLVFALLPYLSLCQEYIEGCVDVEGVKHKLNDSYVGPDGCNNCKCIQGGSACTRKYCDPKLSKKSAEANQCVDNKGNLFKVGESYTHVDGCNTCHCKSFGGACTKKMCFSFKNVVADVCVDPQGRVKSLDEVWTAEDGCNKCKCGPLGPICTLTKCLKKEPQSVRSGQIVDETGDSPCRLDDGTVKYPGDDWLSEDSCNICTCTGLNGNVDCTKQGCRARLLKLSAKQKIGGNSGTVLLGSALLLSSCLILLS